MQAKSIDRLNIVVDAYEHILGRTQLIMSDKNILLYLK